MDMGVLKPRPGVLFQGVDGRWVWLCASCGNLNVSRERPIAEVRRKGKAVVDFYPCQVSHQKEARR